MNPILLFPLRLVILAFGLLLLLEAPATLMGEPAPPAALAAFDQYANAVEARLADQHRSALTFLAPPNDAAQLRRGEPALERLPPPPGAGPAGAMLHHWRGTAFVPGACVQDFESLLRRFDEYPSIFSPEVVTASALTPGDDHMQATMRVRQRHVLTVTLDTTYDIRFGRLDAQHGYSLSRSTHIAEVGPGPTPGTDTEDHGFLWRLNTYWSYEQRDGGLYLQIESLSLTRSIPAGLAWVVRPYVDSIPRESLEFTLTRAAQALRRRQPERTAG